MDLIADSELERTEFFHDWCRRVDQYYILGSVFSLDGGSLAAVAVHRPHSSGNYDERDKALVALFLPHLQRALQLRRRLAEPGIAAGAALDALERSGMATVVVTRDGRVLYANREAERLAQGVTGSP